MRQTISGLVAAIAVMSAGAAPASACGVTACSPCGDWAYQRLAEPETQYYYVDQGPTYGGPGAFAPYPSYRESALPVWGAYRRHPHYYGGAGVASPAVYGYRWHHRFHFIPRHASYRYGTHHYRMRYGYHYGHPVLRRYD
jgi:hypothetical protein